MTVMYDVHVVNKRYVVFFASVRRIFAFPVVLLSIHILRDSIKSHHEYPPHQYSTENCNIGIFAIRAI